MPAPLGAGAEMFRERGDGAIDYKTLLRGIEYSGTLPAGDAPLVAQDSRAVVPGAAFVCIEGKTSNGHRFAAAALEAGAGLIVSRRPRGLPNEVTVADTRAAYAEMCANFFGRPADSLTLVGVTGTNGKTTVASVLKQLLINAGLSCGLIGTIHSEIGQLSIPARFTTPEPWELHALLARMVSAGCSHVVMEASSQALAQGRLSGLHFALALFTNLSRDHLDYHGGFEDYFSAKKILFSQSDAMLANYDDEWGRRALAECGTAVKRSFSAHADNAADFTAHQITLRPDGVRFAFLGDDFLERVTFPIPGDYSAENALCAAGAAVMLGVEPGKAAEALSRVQGVRGRCEVLYSGDFTVISDFAHTDAALEKLLSSLRPYAVGRLLVLFGCAGDRDAAKRPAMSEAALRYADMIFLTSDNPRTEDPAAILRDALPPLEAGGKPFLAEVDRDRALAAAFEELREGDMLVLCGKGHEDYQVLNGVTLYLNEREMLYSWLHKREMVGRIAE